MSDNEQMNKKVETVADILEEMRGMGNYQRYSGDHAHALADRIEAAWKRERAKVEADALAVGGIVEASRTAEKSSAVGNAAALREAIEPWVAFGEWLLENAGKEGLGAAIREYGPIIRQRLEELRAALAEPPRNCDVGTAEEQEKRFHEKFCVKSCLTCPLSGLKRSRKADCIMTWTQMPYEAEEGESNGAQSTP